MSAEVIASRIEKRLQAEIASAASSRQADCKRAELAAYRARLGKFDEARAELAEVRQRRGRAVRVEVNVWLNLAEGVLDYFENGGDYRTDKVQRAYAIAVASGQPSLHAVCAAWLAQWDYAKLDMESCARHVSEALRLASPADHSTLARACLVAAQALHLANRADLARAWYARSKHHATADGDNVTIGALMHNMAWLRMLGMRQVVLTGSGDVTAGRHALMSAESTARFGELVGDATWPDLTPILRAQVLSLQGDAAQAAVLYGEHLPVAKSASRFQANLLADKAWCHIQLGESAIASECADVAMNGLHEAAHIDDRAAAHTRLMQVFDALERTDEADKHRILAKSAWGTYTNLQEDTVRMLSGLRENGVATL